MDEMEQLGVDQKNESFWNELCGTQLAKQLGVVDSSLDSLARFDDFYIDYYPYLKKYLFLEDMKGKDVLEVGLGFGTVSQLLALAGANYHGLDIAPNAVAMARHRLEQNNKKGDIRVGSMIECPFPDDSFDYVISIGCFHHTGNMQACVNQTRRILKPGGKAIIMVYNKFSLRQWVSWPLITAKNLIFQLVSKTDLSTEKQRKAYDISSTGLAAPETAFFSVKDIENIFNQYEHIKIARENFDDNFKLRLWGFPFYNFGHRLRLLEQKIVRNFGLDLYVIGTK